MFQHLIRESDEEFVHSRKNEVKVTLASCVALNLPKSSTPIFTSRLNLSGSMENARLFAKTEGAPEEQTANRLYGRRILIPLMVLGPVVDNENLAV